MVFITRYAPASFVILSIVGGLLITGRQPHAQVSSAVYVLTQHNDAARTGANLQETTLTVATVAPPDFGLLYSLGPLDGLVYTQPLYVSSLVVDGAARNVVFVATEHNS